VGVTEFAWVPGPRTATHFGPNASTPTHYYYDTRSTGIRCISCAWEEYGGKQRRIEGGWRNYAEGGVVSCTLGRTTGPCVARFSLRREGVVLGHAGYNIPRPVSYVM